MFQPAIGKARIISIYRWDYKTSDEIIAMERIAAGYKRQNTIIAKISS